jgi:hypothetical protein
MSGIGVWEKVIQAVGETPGPKLKKMNCETPAIKTTTAVIKTAKRLSLARTLILWSVTSCLASKFFIFFLAESKVFFLLVANLASVNFFPS